MLRRNAESLSDIVGSEGGRKDLFTSTISGAPARHTTYRAIDGDGLQMPLVVIPAKYDLDDFFVSVATYHQARSPVSAFSHVLDQESSTYIEQYLVGKAAAPRPCDGRMLGGLGAAVGETYLASLVSAESGVAPSYASCKRSLAYVLARARALYPSFRTAYAVGRWEKLRKLTGLSVSRDAVDAVSEVNSFLYGSEPLGASPQGQPSALSFADNQSIQKTLVDLYPRIGPLVAELAGPFDGRMKAFGQLVEQIHLAPRGASADNLAIGFFANRIQPGSFAHARALAKLVNFFPSALVWYGAFCALSDEFSPGEFASGLVSKLARDVVRPFSAEQRPSCDISLEELEVLMRLPPKVEVIKPSQQKIAVVSLMPGVEIHSRYSAEEDQPHDLDRERRLRDSDEDASRLTMLLEEGLAILRRSRVPLRRGVEPIQKRSTKTRP